MNDLWMSSKIRWPRKQPEHHVPKALVNTDQLRIDHLLWNLALWGRLSHVRISMVDMVIDDPYIIGHN